MYKTRDFTLRVRNLFPGSPVPARSRGRPFPGMGVGVGRRSGYTPRRDRKTRRTRAHTHPAPVFRVERTVDLSAHTFYNQDTETKSRPRRVPPPHYPWTFSLDRPDFNLRTLKPSPEPLRTSPGTHPITSPIHLQHRGTLR